MIIRNVRNGEMKEVASIVRNTFSKFNCKEGSKKAVKQYLEQSSDKKTEEELKEKYSKSKIFLVAEDKEKLIGVARGRKDRLTNLFVLGSYHGRGIGKRLLRNFEEKAKKEGSREIKIRASMFATPFYLSQGYKKTTGIRTFHELKIQPLKKVLK